MRIVVGGLPTSDFLCNTPSFNLCREGYSIFSFLSLIGISSSPSLSMMLPETLVLLQDWSHMNKMWCTLAYWSWFCSSVLVLVSSGIGVELGTAE